jgi:hypothetical protein
MFQFRRSSQTGANIPASLPTRSQLQLQGIKPLEMMCELSSTKENESPLSSSYNLSVEGQSRGHSRNRITGSELLECFKQRYGPQNYVAKVKEKKKVYRCRADNF